MDGNPEHTSPPGDSPARWFPWAVFLGCSWTWVIGMFLPVLLVRDYGLWGWLVFAVPNVVGAAAMGWVLRDRDASERFVARHRSMCFAFSVVTVAFHVFFALWMIERIRGFGLLALGVYAAAVLLPANNLTRQALALAAMGISVAMWVMLWKQGPLAVPDLNPRNGPAGPAWYLLPAFVVGFALCPYLDLTFHRARQQTSAVGGRWAFGVGFGVVFFSMIVFTLLYARWVAPAVRGLPLTRLATLFLCIHLIGQSAMTVAFHVRELTPQHNRLRNLLGALLVSVAAAAAGWFASPGSTWRGHDLGEIVYWCILGFYGVVFPGYLWIYLGRSTTAASRVALAACIAVVFPMYWLGFVERRPVWLVVGAMVLVGARFVVPKRRTSRE